MTNSRNALSPRRRTPTGARLLLGPEEVKMLRGILAKDLHRLEAEMAGNDWQDLSEAVFAEESLLRRLLGDLSA